MTESWTRTSLESGMRGNRNRALAVGSFLQKLVGEEVSGRVNTDLFERKFYMEDLGAIPSFLRDALFQSLPDILVRPKSVEEVSLIMKSASDCNLSVTPRASGTTGLFNSVPVKGGVLLDLTGLSGLIDLNARDETAIVYAGTRWRELEEALRWSGYALMTYPTSAPSSSVGGWFSTGGMGVGSLKYGCMHGLVKSARVVLPSGEIKRLSDDSSPSLRRLGGTEGTLGVIAELELKVRKTPERDAQHLFGYTKLEGLLDAALALSASSARPYHMHFHDGAFSRMVERAGFDSRLPKGESLLYVRYEGFEEEVGEGSDKAIKLSLERGGKELGDDIAEEHWDNRFSEVRIKRAGPTLLGAEVLLPLKNLAEFVSRVKRIGVRAGIPISVYGSIVNSDACQLNAFFPSDERRAFPYLLSMGLTGKLHGAATRSGGRPYGAGLWNTPYIRNIYGPEELARRTELKRLIDPRGIMNPGKLYSPPHLFLRRPFFSIGMNTLFGLRVLNPLKTKEDVTS